MGRGSAVTHEGEMSDWKEDPTHCGYSLFVATGLRVVVYGVMPQ